MKRRPGVIALAVTGAVAVGGATAYAAFDQERPSDERGAIERLQGNSRDDRERRLVAWLDELTAPKTPASEILEVTAHDDQDVGDNSPNDEVAYLVLLEKRQAFLHDLAELWSPNEYLYQTAQGSEREDLIVQFVSDHISALDDIMVQVEHLDQQIAAVEESR